MKRGEVLDAVLLLDKPERVSSNAALQAARRLFGAAKAGHGGTLDPLASGLLPVLFGEATKFAQGALDAEKEYVATVCLGVRTATGDAEGKVLEILPVAKSTADIERALIAFRGEIEQVPPMHSALRRGGKRLYQLARAGRTVERKPRAVCIFSLELLSRREHLLELRVRCSKGTYIRTLAEDIGEALGTGAHLAALRRTAVGRARVENAATFDQIEAEAESRRARFLLPADALLGELPRVELDRADEQRVFNGLAARAHAAAAGNCRLYGAHGEFLGLGRGGEEGVVPLRLVSRQSQAALK